MIYEQRVIFGDTDQMGIVYYANYYRYFEGARAAYLRAHGKSNQDMLQWRTSLPVVESHCVYKSSAYYEDLLMVNIRVENIGGASVRFGYDVTRDDTLLVHGYTVHACVDPTTGKARRIPSQLRALLEVEPG